MFLFLYFVSTDVFKSIAMQTSGCIFARKLTDLAQDTNFAVILDCVRTLSVCMDVKRYVHV